MSPSAAAPSKASVIAWSTTSASLCPASPRSCAISIPPSISGPGPAKAWTSKPIPVRLTRRAASAALGAVEIGGGGQLVEHGVSCDGGDLEPGLDHHGRFVGRGAASGFVIGVEQVFDVKGLRGLDAEQVAAVDHRVERAAALGERVGHRQHRHRAVMPVERVEQAVDDLGRAEGARGVVDQDDAVADRGKPGADAVGAFGAADDQRADVARRRARPAPSLPARRRSRPAPRRSADVTSWRRPHARARPCRRAVRYCLGTSPPMRLPDPAATMRAVTVMMRSGGRAALAPPCPLGHASVKARASHEPC